MKCHRLTVTCIDEVDSAEGCNTAFCERSEVKTVEIPCLWKQICNFIMLLRVRSKGISIIFFRVFKTYFFFRSFFVHFSDIKNHVAVDEFR